MREAVDPLSNLLKDDDCSWYTKALVVEALADISTNQARAALAEFSSHVDCLLQMLEKGKHTTTREFRLLEEFVSRRHVALGGDPLDKNELARMMEMALSQFRSELRRR